MYEFRQYSRQYLPQIADLGSRIFGGQPDDFAAYIKWKYERNPYIDEPIVPLALVNDRVVGVLGMYGSCWRFGNSKPYKIPVGADFVVDVGHRGRWVAQRLFVASTEVLVERGFDYAFSLSANLLTRRMRFRAGSVRAATYHTYSRIVSSPIKRSIARATAALPTPVQRVIRGAGSMSKLRGGFNPFRKFDRWHPSSKQNITSTAEPRIRQMSELVSRYFEPSLFRHVRDEQYYEWRLQNPRALYRYLYFESASGLEGFIVLHQSVLGGTVTIVDWAASGIKVWAALLSAVVSSGITDLQIISTGFSTAQQDVLAQLGFTLLREVETDRQPAPGLLIDARQTAENDSWLLDGENIIDPNRWDMRMIFSDAY
jgi:GNAT superfamily N-acetyltransferase